MDFNDYLQRVYLTVKRNWFAVMPASVQLGDQRTSGLDIQRSGGMAQCLKPIQNSTLGQAKSHWIERQFRRSEPLIHFHHCRAAFKGPYIELRYTYFYNLPVQ